MAQRKRAGLITRRSLDRNELQLISISFFAFFLLVILSGFVYFPIFTPFWFLICFPSFHILTPFYFRTTHLGVNRYSPQHSGCFGCYGFVFPTLPQGYSNSQMLTAELPASLVPGDIFRCTNNSS
ncbi:hypothetical protein B0T09DRAFT_142813 [Sordaria sp. MPI-SDFR-AT-0083]|nr:hypothetical protein B0T09DRAFT_142813 [Sordaria sp. MPI-SDFR-AT-0083]